MIFKHLEIFTEQCIIFLLTALSLCVLLIKCAILRKIIWVKVHMETTSKSCFRDKQVWNVCKNMSATKSFLYFLTFLTISQSIYVSQLYPYGAQGMIWLHANSLFFRIFMKFFTVPRRVLEIKKYAINKKKTTIFTQSNWYSGNFNQVS